MPECKTCGTKVIYGHDEVGTKIILDARNHPTYQLGSDGKWYRSDARLSHFVTCPQAAQHSKKRKP